MMKGVKMADNRLDKSIRQDIYERIRDDITCGRLLPGERLTENKLSNMYNVSRSPIREALRQLESEGLISFERNKGIEVSKLSVKQMKEIYDIRSLLEGYAVRISVEQLTKKDISALTNIHKKLITAARDKNIQAWLQNNALFHSYFRDKAGKENLCQLIVMLKRRTYHYQNMSLSYDRYFETYIGHHAAILEACKKKDADLAERQMRQHVQTTKCAIVESLSMNRNLLM
jgi:DNA-binding GntR family transcriptional regulator